MFDLIQVQALVWPLKNIHRVVLNEHFRCSGDVLGVVVRLEGIPSPQSEVLKTLEQVFIAAFHFPSILTRLPVSTAEKHLHHMMLPPPGFTVRMVVLRWWAVSGFLQTWHLTFTPKSSILMSSENFLSHCLRVRQVPFGKLQAGCPVPFTKEWPSSGYSTIQAWLVECCRDGCHSQGSSLSKSQLLSLDWQPALWTFSNYGWWRPLCSLEASKHHECFCILPQICTLRPSLWWLQTILFILGLCSDINRKLRDLIQVCAFPNYVQSSEFTSGGLQSISAGRTQELKNSCSHSSVGTWCT